MKGPWPAAVETRYRAVLTGEQTVEAGPGAAALTRSAIMRLWKRSGGLNVPASGRMIATGDLLSDCVTFEVYFNSKAWTGRR